MLNAGALEAEGKTEAHRRLSSDGLGETEVRSSMSRCWRRISTRWSLRSSNVKLKPDFADNPPTATAHRFSKGEKSWSQEDGEGAKVLRSLVVRSPQWRDVDNRRKAARVAASQGDAQLAQALATGRSAELHKDELLFLARTWGLRSNVWRRRGNKRPGSAAAPDDLLASLGAADEPARPEVSAHSSRGAAPPPLPLEASLGPDPLYAPRSGPGLLGVLAPLDRTVLRDPVDPPSLLVSLHNNMMPRIRELGEQYIQLQVSAGSVCGPLVLCFGGGFLTEATSQALALIAQRDMALSRALEQLRIAATVKLMQAKALGPPGTPDQPVELAQNDFAAEVLGRRLYDMFLDMKNEILRLKAERGGAATNPAQTAWEELHVRMYLTQLEALATTLRAYTMARRDSAAPGAAATYLQVVSASLNYACDHVTSITAAVLVRKRWVDSIIAARTARDALVQAAPTHFHDPPLLGSLGQGLGQGLGLGGPANLNGLADIFGGGASGATFAGSSAASDAAVGTGADVDVVIPTMMIMCETIDSATKQVPNVLV